MSTATYRPRLLQNRFRPAIRGPLGFLFGAEVQQSLGKKKHEIWWAGQSLQGALDCGVGRRFYDNRKASLSGSERRRKGRDATPLSCATREI